MRYGAKVLLDKQKITNRLAALVSVPIIITLGASLHSFLPLVSFRRLCAK